MQRNSGKSFKKAVYIVGVKIESVPDLLVGKFFAIIFIYVIYYKLDFFTARRKVGFSLASAVSAENFEKKQLEIYDKSILVVPTLLNNKVTEGKLTKYIENGGKVIVYGSEKYLSEVKFDGMKVDIYGDTKQLFSAMKKYGYEFEFVGYNGSKLPSLTIHRSNNAVIFLMYNSCNEYETAATWINFNFFIDKISIKCYNKTNVMQRMFYYVL